MSKLLKAQQKFSRMVPRLIDKAHELGFEITFGDAYRPDSVSYGRRKSLHKYRLAIDINLFRGDKYLVTTEDHQILGEWWESQGGTWGGKFMDGNHYSLSIWGLK